MGIIEEIVAGYYAMALYPVYKHIHERHMQMQDEFQKVVQAQAIMEIAYDNQEIKKHFEEDLEESIRC